MTSGITSTSSGIKGAVDKILAKNVERILAIPGAKLYKQFVKDSQSVEQTQQKILNELLWANRDTVFGKEHGFGTISTYKEYSQQLPVRDYEQHRPYVDRHAKGESDVLFAGKPMLFTRTSGTTDKPKLIPISKLNFERTIKNRGKLWLHGLARNFPGIYKGKDFTIVSPAKEGQTDDGIPFGSLSGMIYRNIPDFIKLVHTIPYDVIEIDDYDAKAYCLLRFGVPSDVSSIFTGNPSTVLSLAERADAQKEMLFKDIFDGTLSKDINLKPDIRQKVSERLKPARKRAFELEKMAGAEAGGRLRPADYWPNLKLVNTWTNGNCRLVVPKLKPWFNSDTPILDFGYLASEITATDIIDPQTQGSLLAINSGFYEFTPLEEGESPATFLQAHQLDVGQRYYIYVTTFSGLYRYDMNDVVEIVGKFNQVPIIKFLHKGKGITSISGEKLSEEQLIEAVSRVSSQENVQHDFFVGYADVDEQKYKLFIELKHQYSEALIARFASAMDQVLCDMNIEYNSKRKSYRLGAIEVVPLCENAFEQYRALRLKEGAHEGQFKWLHLSSTAVTKQRMERLSTTPPAHL